MKQKRKAHFWVSSTTDGSVLFDCKYPETEFTGSIRDFYEAAFEEGLKKAPEWVREAVKGRIRRVETFRTIMYADDLEIMCGDVCY